MKKSINSLLVLGVFFGFVGSFLGVQEVSAAEISNSCNGTFYDVNNSNVFCPYIEYLGGEGIVSGSGGNYMPYSNITRGQISKVIKNAFAIPTDTTGGVFPDVQNGYTFYTEIMSLRNAGIISGYSDGLFRPDDYVSRGAIMKMLYNSSNYVSPGTFPDYVKNEFDTADQKYGMCIKFDNNEFDCVDIDSEPNTVTIMRNEYLTDAQVMELSGDIQDAEVSVLWNQLFDVSGKFSDVPVSSKFVKYIKPIYESTSTSDSFSRIINGYQDGTFKPDNSMTRAEVSKVVANTLVYKDSVK